jgi:hypothetical protein
MGEQYFCIRAADTKIRPAGLSAAIPGAWAADRFALPTRGFAHGLLVRPFWKIATIPGKLCHAAALLFWQKSLYYISKCNNHIQLKVSRF